MRLVWLAVLQLVLLGGFVSLAGAKEPADGVALSGVEGVYRIVRHRETSDCSLPEEEWREGDERDGLFRLTMRRAAGRTLLCWSECFDIDHCDDSCQANRLFEFADGSYQCDTFEYEEFVRTPEGSTCTVGPGLAVLERTDVGVRWEESISVISLDTGDEVMCDADLAEDFRNLLECRSMRRFEAQRVR